jgi:hypothetical protein
MGGVIDIGERLSDQLDPLGSMNMDDVSGACPAPLRRRSQAQRNRALRLTHWHAAGIDIGSESHFVAAPPDCDDEPVRNS